MPRQIQADLPSEIYPGGEGPERSRRTTTTTTIVRPGTPQSGSLVPYWRVRGYQAVISAAAAGLDTQAKRASAMLEPETLPYPDGSIANAADRGWMLSFYTGLSGASGLILDSSWFVVIEA